MISFGDMKNSKRIPRKKKEVKATIVVDPSVRDRIKAAADESGMTAKSLASKLLEKILPDVESKKLVLCMSGEFSEDIAKPDRQALIETATK